MKLQLNTITEQIRLLFMNKMKSTVVTLDDHEDNTNHDDSDSTGISIVDAVLAGAIAALIGTCILAFIAIYQA